jgi:hypothetical protein
MNSNIPLTPVQSSQIHAIGHDPASNTLVIQFRSKREAPRGGAVNAPGSIYHYANVGADLFEKFRTAESVGSFFYKNIKPHADKYPYTRIEDRKDAA